MTITTLAATGCARAVGAAPDDAPGLVADARPRDGAPPVDAALDGARPGPDAGCAISQGVSPAIDGVDDLLAYPAAQHLTPGAMLGSDGAAVAWDAANLYVTVGSLAFAADYEPLHVYVESATALHAPVPAQGKEYSGLTPMLPFTPTHLIAARRTDAAYDGVYVGAPWATRTTLLAPDAQVVVAADHGALSVVVPWAALGGCPSSLRLAMHVVHAVAANEWKDLVPATATPWLAPGGGYYEIDLTGAAAVASWTLR